MKILCVHFKYFDHQLKNLCKIHKQKQQWHIHRIPNHHHLQKHLMLKNEKKKLLIYIDEIKEDFNFSIF